VIRPIRFAAALSLAMSLAATVQGVPTVGQPMPSFAIDDFAGTRHTERDLRGHWTVAMVITDKDVADDLRVWSQRLHPALADPDRLMSFLAINISTPKAAWR